MITQNYEPVEIGNYYKLMFIVNKDSLKTRTMR